MRRAANLWFLILFLVAIWGCLTSCSDPASPPSDTEVSVRFIPAGDDTILELDQEVEFRVRVQNSPEWSVAFLLGDSLVSEQESFLYRGSRLGWDSLVAQVTLPNSTRDKGWRIEVEAGSAVLPPVVPGFALNHGHLPGSLVISWSQSPPSATPRPITHYLIKASSAGPLSPANWEEAALLGTVPHLPGQGFYQKFCDDDEFSVILPGELIWVAVRSQDVAGLLSPLGTVLNLRVTAPYWITGTVRDDTDRPLNDVIVDYGCDTCKTTTDLDGNFSLGPFREDKRYSLRTITGGQFYDFRTDTIGIETSQSVDIRIINQWGVDVECATSYYDGEFLTFLRQMTRTNPADTNSNRVFLWKWRDYPISVFVFATLNEEGTFQLRPLALKALEAWNQKLGEDYFQVVSQQGGADLIIYFSNLGLGGLQGVTEIIDPPGFPRINEVIPNKMLITVKKGWADSTAATEVLLHELGHALCMGAHSGCNDALNPIHIMSIPFARIIEANNYSLVASINDDEKNAARAIRYLFQGTSMAQFIEE